MRKPAKLRKIIIIFVKEFQNSFLFTYQDKFAKIFNIVVLVLPS
jgi:hypothetical protein